MDLQENISRIKEVMGILNESEETNMSIREDYGMGSDDISANERIQQVLGMDVTGNFDSETDKCVRTFQDYTNIRVDGIVGPETEGKMNELLSGKIDGWKGCKSMPKVSVTRQSQSGSDNYNLDIADTKTNVGGGVVGSSWNSCKAWRGRGGLDKWGQYIKINKSNSQFTISYSGPSSGISIAHANGGGDTIHQVYNVLICELNPFLANGGMRPDIAKISIESSSIGKNHKITINVPLVKSPNTYQIDRRGGWNHNPGPSKMKSKCDKINRSGGKCYGPVQKIVTGGFGKITEYFITHTL